MNVPTRGVSLAEAPDLVRAAGRHQPHTTEVLDREVWAPFERWCAATGRTPMPASEDTLITYIEEHPRWSWAYSKQVTVVVNRVHTRKGHAKPGGSNTKEVLRRIARQRGRVTEPLVDDFSTVELRAIARNLLGEPGGDDPILRMAAATAGSVILGLRSPLDTSTLSEVWRGIDIELQPGELAASYGTTRRLLRDTDEPFITRVLRRAAAVKAERPDCGDLPFGRSALTRAWRRAGLGPAPKLLPVDMCHDDLVRLIVNIDPDAHRRLRDRAYLLTGVSWALRHEDLAHLRIEHVHTDPDCNGYRAYFTRSKADPDGQRPPRLLPHVRTEAGRCDELCPACALGDYLRVVIDVQNRTTGYLFATLYAGKWEPMTRQNARLRVQKAWLRTNPPSGKRISTRSCRVTGATLAYQAGIPVADIAAQVTLHASVDEADRYIRRHNETDFQLRY